jgi:formylglycine-generating enzyme required for sulfatase activity
VGGVCKLADIGLVATHGERSFVGTEGFVPPEGPGTFAADIYSLGKVLYEISSGKDRMEFPEVPDDLDAKELDYWRDWNRVICRACAPMVADRYASAAEFANELRQVGVPKPVPFSRRAARAITQIAISAVVAGSALSMATHQREWRIEMPAPNGKLTPDEIARQKLPAEGRLWIDKAGIRFPWRDKKHMADRPVNLELFSAFLEDTMRPFEGEVVPWTPNKGAKTEYAVVVPSQDADAFCDWMGKEDRAASLLNDDYEYRWKPDTSVKQSAGAKQHWSALRLELARLHFGDVEITTEPEDADILVNGESIGYTPQNLSRVRVGDVTYEIRLPGYKAEILHGTVDEKKPLKLHSDLRPTRAVVFGKKWTNSLGMEMAPLGEVLMSTAETRRADFAEYYKRMVYSNAPPVPFDTNVDFPVTFVSRNDAVAFCRWLTKVERDKQLLEPNQSYRLPTDDEWSMAAGLPREKGGSPAERNGRIQGMYPWGGFEWPPNPPAGNYWDTSAADAMHKKDGIPNYNDNFPGLAPVRSFPADPHTEMYDLAGNVWEWVQEDFGGSDPKQQRLGVVRGGSWRTKDRNEMLASFRKPVSPGTRTDEIGFRVVLSVDGARAREEE